MIEAINDEDAIMIVIDRNADGILELAWLVAMLAELGHEREAIIAITREYLHSIIATIGDEQEASMMVEHQAKRVVELAISIASFLGADRELDSSITIKSIVFHLFHFNLSLSLSLSLSQRQRDVLKLQTAQTQRDEYEALTHETRDTRHQASKQATRNKKQQEPIERTATHRIKQ